eukprot:8854735-Ditylum_brightwellii.AAC.1
MEALLQEGGCIQRQTNIIGKCSKCYNWEYFSNDNIHLNESVPGQYQNKKHPDSPLPPFGWDITTPGGKLPNEQISYDYL